MNTINRLLDMLNTGIQDGSLARFIFVLLAVFLLGYLTVSGNLAKPETQVVVTIATMILGYYFGANKPQPPSTGAITP